MKLICVITAVAALLLGAICVYAEKKEFWESKPYTEWTEKEVDKLLKDSPWAKTIPLSTGPENVSSGGEDSAAAGGGYRQRPMLVVTWYSRIVREALARRLLLANPSGPQEQIDQLVHRRESAFHDLAVIGWSPGRNKEALSKLKEETYIQTKQNKEKIPLKDVILPQRRGDPLVLRFAREADGQPMLTLEDKEVQLVLKMGDNTIRTSFKLADMVVNDKLEL